MTTGGMKESGGYKGYGLAMMIEILWDMGAKHNTVGEDRSTRKLVTCFIVLDPFLCGTGFQDRLQSMADMFRNLEPRDPCKPVMVPGDPERFKEKTVQDNGGVKYSKLQFDRFVGFSNNLNVSCPAYKKHSL